MEKRLLKGVSMLVMVLMLLGIAYAITEAEEAHAAAKGLVKKGGYIYYYKNGRRIKNKSVKVKGKWYYFSAKGRGFRSVKDKTGNKAVAKVIDHVKFKKGMKRSTKLKKCYKYIIKMSYFPELIPDTSTAKWYFPVANRMADKKGGKCYGFASLTAACAKAMGYKGVILHKGLAKRTQRAPMTEHCWVTINSKVLDASYDNSYWYRTGQPKTPVYKFFLKTYDAIKLNPDNFKVTYKDKDTYIL